MDLKISLLNFNFVMIYIIHKILVLLKNHLNYLKDSIFECFFKEYNRLSFFYPQALKTSYIAGGNLQSMKIKNFLYFSLIKKQNFLN